QNGLDCANAPYIGQTLVIPPTDVAPLLTSKAITASNISKLKQLRAMNMACVLSPGELFFAPDGQFLISGSAMWQISRNSILIQAADEQTEGPRFAVWKNGICPA
ncbi:MAG: hypothetical protein KJ638_05465, partial [Chloroflexi bacterium]|nr:hypothetical protein [Chloroflexota bacterium]